MVPSRHGSTIGLLDDQEPERNEFTASSSIPTPTVAAPVTAASVPIRPESPTTPAVTPLPTVDALTLCTVPLVSFVCAVFATASKEFLPEVTPATPTLPTLSSTPPVTAPIPVFTASSVLLNPCCLPEMLDTSCLVAFPAAPPAAPASTGLPEKPRTAPATPPPTNAPAYSSNDECSPAIRSAPT